MQPLPFFAQPADAVHFLTRPDYEEFLQLQISFSRQGQAHEPHPPSAAFRRELEEILRFVERRSEDRELRANAAGVIRVSQFLCVNTRVLKNLVHRCKSSINHSLQQLGCASVRGKAGAALASELSSLFQCSTAARQWSVRTCEGLKPLDVARTRPGFAPLPVPITTRQTSADACPSDALDDPMTSTSFFSDDMEEKFREDFGLFFT
jgi:hypothetical protein